MRQKKPTFEIIVTSQKPVPYRLVVRTAERGTPATLTSPLLDSDLHHRAGVTTYCRSVKGPGKDGKDGGITLDPFEAASLAAYLMDQASVRRQLERALDALLKTWDERGEIGRGGKVWKQTKIDSIHFAPRKLPTAQELEVIQGGYSKKEAKAILAENFDTPAARSSFAIMMQPEWALDHLLRIQFRDGKSMELNLEG
jgi:hypothetical protein